MGRLVAGTGAPVVGGKVALAGSEVVASSGALSRSSEAAGFLVGATGEEVGKALGALLGVPGGDTGPVVGLLEGDALGDRVGSPVRGTVGVGQL